MEQLLTLMLKDYGPEMMYATYVRKGLKKIETRTWKTKHRGPLLIGCRKSSASIYAGKIICKVDLYHIEPMIKEHEEYACCKLYDRANSWFFKNLQIPSYEFDVKGKLNLFYTQVPQDVTWTDSDKYDFEIPTKNSPTLWQQH